MSCSSDSSQSKDQDNQEVTSPYNENAAIGSSPTTAPLTSEQAEKEAAEKAEAERLAAEQAEKEAAEKAEAERLAAEEAMADSIEQALLKDMPAVAPWTYDPSLYPIPEAVAYDPTQGWEQTSRWSVKTNGIGWLMLVSNVAVEWQIEDCFSIEVPVYFSAMNYFTSKVKFRTFTVQPELRYWFGCHDCDLRDRWFVGAHFGVGSWNYAVNGDWRYQDHLGKNPSVGGGISAGYRMGLGEKRRWALEFNLGVGVYSAYYDKFYIGNNGPYAEKGLRKTWWGIDRAAVSIVYTFGKGGGR